MELFKIENMKENSFNFSNIDNLRKICKFNDVLTWGSNKSRGKKYYLFIISIIIEKKYYNLFIYFFKENWVILKNMIKHQKY